MAEWTAGGPVARAVRALLNPRAHLDGVRIIDAQGFQTMVVLDKVERGRRIDQDLFKIQYEAVIGAGNNR